jgi:hypothetical protein
MGSMAGTFPHALSLGLGRHPCGRHKGIPYRDGLYPGAITGPRAILRDEITVRSSPRDAFRPAASEGRTTTIAPFGEPDCPVSATRMKQSDRAGEARRSRLG